MEVDSLNPASKSRANRMDQHPNGLETLTNLAGENKFAALYSHFLSLPRDRRFQFFHGLLEGDLPHYVLFLICQWLRTGVRGQQVARINGQVVVNPMAAPERACRGHLKKKTSY
jgi:hypothetical protein